MSGTEQSTGGVGRLSPMTTTGIMVAAVVAFFVLFVLAFFLYLRANRYWGAIPVSAGTRLASFAATRPRGLDAAAVAALPSVVVSAGALKEGLECAVCICELSEGDAARLLPKCGHAFHLECIDMWFCSHSTCPLCRSSAELVKPESAVPGAESAPGDSHSFEPSLNSAADVLPCTSEGQVTSESSSAPEGSSSTAGSSYVRSEDALANEMPRTAVDGFQTPSSPLPVERTPEEEIRSPTAPALRSLRRLLIRGSRMAGASCSP
ncbi:RING-H2 finger protein [Musa troglodytarum]|uniref:RING-H2 finger protein n=1 Tax=Musa troglodytarum TaxID=320322 RepID=A0A9E7EIY1_9LILI|nr:RING-H2 finger protein [Musa troglodytarum]